MAACCPLRMTCAYKKTSFAACHACASGFIHAQDIGDPPSRGERSHPVPVFWVTNDGTGATDDAVQGLTRGTAQGVCGALHLAVQLPAVARVYRRLQPVHLRHQRIRVRAGLCQLCTDLRHDARNVHLAFEALPALDLSHRRATCCTSVWADTGGPAARLPHLLEFVDHRLDLVYCRPDVVIYCWPVIQCRLL